MMVFHRTINSMHKANSAGINTLVVPEIAQPIIRNLASKLILFLLLQQFLKWGSGCSIDRGLLELNTSYLRNAMSSACLNHGVYFSGCFSKSVIKSGIVTQLIAETSVLLKSTVFESVKPIKT